MSKEYDTLSEADSSDTLSSQRIYTPTSGMTGSGSTVSGDEHTDVEAIPEHVPLLFDQPPNYADAACGDDEKTPLPLNEVSAKEIEAGNNKDGKDSLPGPGPRRGRGVGCRRGRFRRVCLIVSLKMLLLVGGLGWLVWVFGGFGHSFNWSRFRHCHPNTKTTAKPSREITLDNGARSIWGEYPLLDQLSLSTTSGSIAVAVIPQPADPDNPDEPARLRIRSESGSIAVGFATPETAMLPELQRAIRIAELDDEMTRYLDGDDDNQVKQSASRRSRKQKQKDRVEKIKNMSKGKFKCKCKNKNKNKNGIYCNKHKNTPGKPPKDLPLRPYIVDIETGSGSITGRFIFSRSINLSTGSGSIAASLIPLVYRDETTSSQNVSIQTQTGAGSQKISLTEPIFLGSSTGSEFVDPNLYPSGPDSDSPNSLSARASHKTEMGSMHISYPKQWGGNVHAESEGSILLRGKGLDVKKGEGGVDGRKEAEEPESGKWWGGNMNVSLGSEEGSILFFVG